MEILEKYHEALSRFPPALQVRWRVRWCGTSTRWEKRPHCGMRRFSEKAISSWNCKDHGISEQRMVNQQLMRLSAETGIELVATNDIHYTYAEDADSHDILLCLQTGKKITDEDRMRYEGGQYFVKSEAEMASLFPYAPQAIENTQKIADRCNVEIEFGVTKLPKFDVPEGYTSWEYLNKLCYDGSRNGITRRR